MGEAVFNHFVQLRIQLGFTAENFGKGKKLPPIQDTTMSKVTEGQLRLVHKVDDVLYRPYTKNFVILRQYNVDRQEQGVLPLKSNFCETE